jgi:hypothetical protein
VVRGLVVEAGGAQTPDPVSVHAMEEVANGCAGFGDVCRLE